MNKEVEFLQYVLEWIVSKPEEIQIDRTEDELGILLTVTVAKDDMWLVIGKWGNTVSALRSVLRLVWLKEWQKVNLKVEG
jgi:predicted RNA-binding protein YlqC (UPF0109 family)